MLGPLWSHVDTQTVLGITDAQIGAASTAGDLLRLTTEDGVPLYPIFQFAFDTTSGSVAVLPGLQIMLAEFHDHDPWTVALLLVTPAPELGGPTPVQALRDGYPVERLREFARHVYAKWADPLRC